MYLKKVQKVQKSYIDRWCLWLKQMKNKGYSFRVKYKKKMANIIAKTITVMRTLRFWYSCSNKYMITAKIMHLQLCASKDFVLWC